MEFNSFLSHQLDKFKISYRKLEEDTGISRGNISRYIQGKKNPNMKPVVRFANYFGELNAEEQGLTEGNKDLLIASYILEIVKMVGGQDVGK